MQEDRRKVAAKMERSVTVRRPKRWDRPFDPSMTTAAVEWVLATSIFRNIDSSDFPPGVPLPEIVRNDARIVTCRPGEIVVREGDYGNSLFIVAEGTVRTIAARQKPRYGRPRKRRRFMAQMAHIASLLGVRKGGGIIEQRDPVEISGGREVFPMQGFTSVEKPVLSHYEKIIASHETAVLESAEIFGETAAMSRSPHNASVFADQPAVLIELRWQGMRDLRRWSGTFRRLTDRHYRAGDLRRDLREVPYLKNLRDKELDLVAKGTLLESRGDREWSNAYKQELAEDGGNIAESEPAVVEAGDYLDGLIVVRYGFGRVTKPAGQGIQTIGFLTKNELFGLEEIIRHWRGEGPLQYQRGLRAVGYVDYLRIPTSLVEEHVLPQIFPKSRSSSGTEWRLARTPGHGKPADQSLDEAALNFLVNNRYINGTSVMFIDTDRCTACDDCVRACAAAHNGNPRFVRHGAEQAHLMVTNACMHCVDPVCMIGCPTGAIHRNTQDGAVLINDRTCIGCAICANSCPYDNIRMVEVRDGQGRVIVDDETRVPLLKATKCDLCQDHAGGPACQRACPHDALIRLDARERRHLADWIER